MGEEELAILPLIQFQDSLGFRPSAIEQALRVYGESLRRMAENESEWFRSEIVQPMIARGLSEDDVGRFTAEVSPRMSGLSDEAVLAIYHRQQRHAWSVNIIDGIALALDRAGLHARERSTPAMCFLDITGYTRLNHEHGDHAAADLAEKVRRMVERSARDLRWTGGEMARRRRDVLFPAAGRAVAGALEMVAWIVC